MFFKDKRLLIYLKENSSQFKNSFVDNFKQFYSQHSFFLFTEKNEKFQTQYQWDN